MSETTTETTEVEPTTEEAVTEPPKVNKEARYRVERNQAREELETANARVERMNRREIERLAADGLSYPADLFSLAGNEPADYLTEDGEVNAEKVAADVAAVLAERPGLKRQRFPQGFDPTQGTGGHAHTKREPSLADLLKGSTSQPY